VSWATYPQDPVSGGTWIGVNDDGLVVALLNRTATVSEPRCRPHSRGSIVPTLLACPSIARAVNACDALDLNRFEPFRIVMAHRSTVAVVAGDRAHSPAELFSLVRPVMFTSSSLGDAIVEAIGCSANSAFTGIGGTNNRRSAFRWRGRMLRPSAARRSTSRLERLTLNTNHWLATQ
jgi:hypothetical protein